MEKCAVRNVDGLNSADKEHLQQRRATIASPRLSPRAQTGLSNTHDVWRHEYNGGSAVSCTHTNTQGAALPYSPRDRMIADSNCSPTAVARWDEGGGSDGASDTGARQRACGHVTHYWHSISAPRQRNIVHAIATQNHKEATGEMLSNQSHRGISQTLFLSFFLT